ncbi:MAG: hypothetical protein D6728_00755 [Cyanobacteria bacterium J055]|nr:MAG: hypothetical protein D6728_00755 [Cyanobacteria bacterium J055]
MAILVPFSGFSLVLGNAAIAVSPMPWSLPPLTDEQLEAVRNCDLETVAIDRYPETLTADELLQAYTPTTDCDWAVLARASAQRWDGVSLPESAQNAFGQTIALNPGFIYAPSLFASYFGKIPVVEAPPFTQQEIVAVKIEYRWYGLGNGVSYQVEIDRANTQPIVSGTVNSGLMFGDPTWETPTTEQLHKSDRTLSGTIDPEIVQALRFALTDLVPIDSQFTLNFCTDNYPDWLVSIAFADGTTLSMVTKDSNFLYAGGPWQTTIDGQNYVQFSPEFIQALANVVNTLELPWGEPAGMARGGWRNILDVAFPDR